MMIEYPYLVVLSVMLNSSLSALQEMVKALIQASQGPHTRESMGLSYAEDSAIFFLELLLRVVLQNRSVRG